MTPDRGEALMVESTGQMIEGIPNFWTRVLSADRRVLFLDYDGTLAPVQAARTDPQPMDGVAELVTMIAGSTNTRVAIVSGRPIVELVSLLSPLPVEMVGSNGYEYRDSAGRIHRTPPDRFQSEGLELARRSAFEAGFAARIEQKFASVAFHVRDSIEGFDLNELAKCMWECIAKGYGLAFRDFNGDVELRATGFNKGVALLELLLTEPSDALVVNIGDDETDEDAFQAIRTRGIGIKVGGYGLRTAAIGRLPHCAAVKDFLRSWYNLIARS
jgi:trehalose 6-phosphate phosphatase